MGGWVQANLFTVKPADGSAPSRRLTEGDRLAVPPWGWGRDGFIYFHADVAGRFHIWRLRPVVGADLPGGVYWHAPSS